ncbi:MAG TPA: Ig-like domain-containing protein [Candidatus Angelobacter sp.]
MSIAADSLDNPKDTQPVLDFRAQDPSSGDNFQRYTVGPPGSYTLTVRAGSALGVPPITVTKSFLVVAPGATNNQVTQGQAPIVISNTPLQGVDAVPLSTFPQIVFSEPVANVPANFTFVDAGNNSPSVLLIGVRADGSLASPVGPGDFITSLTVQPLAGLKFNEKYTLTLNSDIIDQNKDANGNPLHLATFVLSFTTFGPQKLDSNTDQFGSTRPVVIGQRVYVGKPANAALSAVDVIDITDPASPLDFGTTNYFAGRVVDANGLASSPVTRCLTEVLSGAPCPQQGAGGPLLAMAATVGATDLVIPSNIWFYDLSNPDQPARVGAVSATTSATQDGTLLRIFMKDQFIYTSTAFKGLQVIDIQQAINEFQATPPTQFGSAITTEGNGFALDAVVNTIPVPLPLLGATGSVRTFQATMMDVKAADYATAAPDPNNPSAPVPTQTFIVATGRLPFVVADPLQSGLSAIVYPPLDNSGIALSQAPWQSSDGQFQLQQGRAVALGAIPTTDPLGNSVNQPIAVTVGSGTVNGSAGIPLLAVVNMTNPKAPLAQSFLPLKDKNNNPVQPVDVVLKDTLALIGTDANKVLLVNLTDPNHPLAAGEVDGVFGDRLALAQGGVLVTSSWNPAIGGIHTAVFDPALVPNQTADSDLSVGYQFRPEGVDVTKLGTATIQVTLDSSDDLKLDNSVQSQNFKSALALSAVQLTELATYATSQIRTNHEFTLYFPKIAGKRNIYKVDLDVPGADIGPITPARVVVEFSQSDVEAREDAVARHFAPVFTQRGAKRGNTQNGEAFEDYFLRVNFDGDWNTWNNEAHLKNADVNHYNLAGYVYYGIEETDFYYFLTYVYYHGTDPKMLGHHANDMEGGHVVVQKSDARVGTAQDSQSKIRGGPDKPIKPGVGNFGNVAVVMAQAHNGYEVKTNNFVLTTGEGDAQPPSDPTKDTRTHPVISSQPGSGFATLAGHGASVPGSSDYPPGDGIRYVPGDQANVAETPQRNTQNGFDKPVHYQLIPFVGDKTSDNQGNQVLSGFWDRRRDDRIFGASDRFSLKNGSPTLGHGIFGDRFDIFVPHCAANLPWGWTGSHVNKGERFLDPMNIVINPNANKLTNDTGHLVKEPQDGLHYISNPFLNDVQFGGTFPTNGAPLFQDSCSCKTILSHIQSGVSRGLNDLPMGAGCQ